MIYDERTRSRSQAKTVIDFKGFKISIYMDPRNSGLLTTTRIMVHDEDHRDISPTLGLKHTTTEGIMDAEGEDLWKVMQAIHKLTSSGS